MSALHAVATDAAFKGCSGAASAAPVLALAAAAMAFFNYR
jgi:hypothetical protein